MAAFPGLHHVAVTVHSCDDARTWYTALFGSEPVLDEDTGPFRHVVYAIGGGALFGAHEHSTQKPPAGDQFSEYRVGLDHVSFGVDSRADLETWLSKLDELGIKNGGIVDASYGSGLSFRDPDGNALEFFAPPGS